MRGIDHCPEAIAAARLRVPDAEVDVQEVAQLVAAGERFDVVLMLEQLPQLPHPKRALGLLTQLAERHVVLSAPWQPYFSALNLARGTHIRALGDDPGQRQDWGRREFRSIVGDHFVIQDAPLVFPWTLVGAAVPQ